MDWINNLPFITIIICMVCGVVSSVLKRRAASMLTYILLVVTTVMSALVTWKTAMTGESFVYLMGHFPAPWGNEIRAGVLEGTLSTFFSVIFFLAILGGKRFLEKDIEESKQNLYYTLYDLLLCSIFALVYTNDLFTAYVFIEINTITACGIIMIKNNGHAIVATTKYMIMSLIGSGLVLIGITLLYDITGNLLMSSIRESVEVIMVTGEYKEPMIVVVGLISIGLAIKSALYPFHSWLPDAHGNSTASSSSVLSSVVLKSFFFLLVKIYFRVIGWDNIVSTNILNMLFIFGLVGMVMGSIKAIGEHQIKRMIVYSSVAQIGYLYMGLGIGTVDGATASLFHIMAHAASKGMLFISVYGLAEVSGGSLEFKSLKGAGYRNKVAGVAFTVGAFSLIGVPLFAGFISKILFANAALTSGSTAKMVMTLVVLAFSTILNTVYFFRAIILIYTPEDISEHPEYVVSNSGKRFSTAMIIFIILNLCLNIFSGQLIEYIKYGLSMFS